MTTSINCNFVRVAVQHHMSKYLTKTNKLPKGSLSRIIHSYNHQFSDNPGLKVTYSVGSRNFQTITRHFNERWEQSKLRDYLKEFSIAKWGSTADKQQHVKTVVNAKNLSPFLPKPFLGQRKQPKYQQFNSAKVRRFGKVS